MRATALLTLLLPVLIPNVLGAAEVPGVEGARYTDDGKLVKPENYREWVTIGTGLNMTYGPTAQNARSNPPYTNVLVNPTAYRAFLDSGAWPDKTVFILEIRASVAVNAAGGNNGYFQGEVIGIEAEVKDTQRFPGGWGFFNLGRTGATGQLIPSTASCYSCHAKNAAVENTFVQFYPVLRDVAKEKGTLKKVAESF